MKIKNLLFDLGGVIMDIRRENCIAAFQALGFTDVAKYLGDYEQTGFFGRLEQGLITPKQFRDEVRAVSGLDLTDVQIDNAFNAFLTGIPPERLLQLEQLRRHHKVYMLSNTNKIMWDSRIADDFSQLGYDVNHYFDGTVTSFEAKVCKPDHAIFEYVAKKFGISPTETLFLDDSEANCEAARACGYQAAHVTQDKGFFTIVNETLPHLQ